MNPIFHPESVLAGAYVLLLMVIAGALERAAERSHRRAASYQTAGFRFHSDRDVWECPTGMSLVRAEIDPIERVVRYRAPAWACNNCAVKARCTHSDRGREIPVPMDPVMRSAVRRFQSGISLVLLTLCALITVIELFRYGRGLEGWSLGGLLLLVIGLVKKTIEDLRANPIAGLEPVARTDRLWGVK